MDGSVLERCNRGLDKAGFIQGVCVNEALYVVLVANTCVVLALSSRSTVRMTSYLKHVSMHAGVVPQSS